MKLHFSLAFGLGILTAAAIPALANAGDAKVSVRGAATRDASNHITVTTDGLLENASVTILQSEASGSKCSDRAGAISSQMTHCSAVCTPASGANPDTITISPIGTGTLMGVGHNGLNGEQVNVNPQSLALAGTVFHAVGGVGVAGESCSLEFPQLNVHVTVPISDGMPAQALSGIMFIRLTAQGMTGQLTSNGFTLDPVLIGGDPGAAVDPFTLGANFTYTGTSYSIDVAYTWTTPPPPPCGSADFNCDGDVGTDADIESFFACLAGNCPAPPCTSSADFNGDGDVGTDADIEAFFRVLAGGNC